MAYHSLIHDPETRAKIIEYLALGHTQSKVAEAFGVTENTVTNWKKNKTFMRELATAELEMSAAPIRDLMERDPKAWLERKFRDSFAPPKQTTALEHDVGPTLADILKGLAEE